MPLGSQEACEISWPISSQFTTLHSNECVCVHAACRPLLSRQLPLLEGRSGSSHFSLADQRHPAAVVHCLLSRHVTVVACKKAEGRGLEWLHPQWSVTSTNRKMPTPKLTSILFGVVIRLLTVYCWWRWQVVVARRPRLPCLPATGPCPTPLLPHPDH